MGWIKNFIRKHSGYEELKDKVEGLETLSTSPYKFKSGDIVERDSDKDVLILKPHTKYGWKRYEVVYLTGGKPFNIYESDNLKRVKK